MSDDSVIINQSGTQNSNSKGKKKMKTNEINLGLLLADQVPETYGLIAGYDEASRAAELIRLGSMAPAGCHGYVDQLRSGTRAVRLDAARQLQRHGIEFGAIPQQ